MSTTPIMNTFVFLLATTYFLHAMASDKRKCNFTPKYTVYVANSLPPKSPPLIAHCASKDDDFGNHTLTSGQSFNWSFCDSYIENTLFFCHFWWGTKERAFDVYTSKDKSDCFKHACYWEADADGIYFDGTYPPQLLSKVYEWN
ncbi:hypothetical protein Pfo_029173 [Paulownia fortunei]|nr:hypothetical protein Pfo_029173 [Paulownia fortunei]